MGGRVAGAEAVMAEQSTGRGRRGVVVAAAPGAAAVGAEAMRAGGNAYDAVVCALLAETVLLPP
jgi:gamma-glutamyltranspeptidase